jgi:hypothetical protein
MKLAFLRDCFLGILVVLSLNDIFSEQPDLNYQWQMTSLLCFGHV